MPPDSIDLDGHRSDADQRATVARRRREAVRQDQSRLEQRQEALEAFALAGPAETWPEAAARAQYLIQMLADSCAIADRRRRALIDSVFKDFAFLTQRDKRRDK